MLDFAKTLVFLVIVGVGVTTILLDVKEYNRNEPPTNYECPCEVEEIVTDVVRHTNKEGMQTVTTIINLEKCLPYAH